LWEAFALSNSIAQQQRNKLVKEIMKVKNSPKRL
jgi:hypothetical protein